MKQQFLGSFIGRLLLLFRDKFEILYTAYFYSESVGRVANDHLATRLVTTICQPNKTFIDVGAHIGSIIVDLNKMIISDIQRKNYMNSFPLLTMLF
jgi:hypothetical protein